MKYCSAVIIMCILGWQSLVVMAQTFPVVEHQQAITELVLQEQERPFLFLGDSQDPETSLFWPTIEPFHTGLTFPSAATFFTLNIPVFEQLVASTDQHYVLANVGITSSQSVTLHLQRFEVMAPTAIVVEGTKAGDRPFVPGDAVFLRGTVQGQTKSWVYLAVFRDYVAGSIEWTNADGSREQFAIAPVDLDQSETTTMIVYRPAEVLTENTESYCATADMPEYEQHMQEMLQQRAHSQKDKQGSQLQSAETLVAHIAVDCDQVYYNRHGRNLSRAVQYAQQVMGSVSAVYQRDVNVVLQMPYLRVWTATDPYPSSSSGGKLGQLRTHWNANMRGVERTLTHLFSGVRFGGVAWVNQLCSNRNTGFGYAVSGLNNNVNFPTANYNWETDVVSHELGHNFSSPHTHNCSWGPAIDSCFTAEGGCFGGTVGRVGTIMSYCHLTIFGKELYLHPRVATQIRLRSEQALCVQALKEASDNDVAALQLVTPAAGGAIARGAQFIPSAVFKNVGKRDQTDLTVRLIITNSSGVVVYNNTRVIAALAADEVATVNFDATSLGTDGLYEVEASITLATDARTVNNTVMRQCEVVANVTGSVTLLHPNTAIDLTAGDVATIRWTHSGLSQVMLEYTPDDGATWHVIRGSQTANTGSFNWTVPGVATTQARVRISSRTNAAINDMSDQLFTIKMGSDVGVIDLIRPLPNSTLNAPFVPEVMVTNYGDEKVTNVPVQLRMVRRTNQAEAYIKEVVVDEIEVGARINVQFPLLLIPTDEYNIYARTLLVGDQQPSNDSLTRTARIQASNTIALTSFTTGGEICDGSVQEITWITLNTVNRVNIDFSDDDGANYTRLASNLPAADGRWVWNVDAAVDGFGPQCRIRVLNADVGSESDMSDLAFAVYLRPAITNTLADQASCIGTTVRFTIAANGDNLRYQWRKDGVDIPDATNEQLVLPSIDDSDAGQYDIVVSGSCEPVVVSNQAVVSILHPPVIVSQSESMPVCENKPLILEVEATGDELVYQWVKDGTNLQGANQAHFEVPMATPDVNGTYQVRIRGACGNLVTSEDIEVWLEFPPKMFSHPESRDVCIDDQVQLTTMVEGDNLEFQWRKDGIDIPDATNASLSFVADDPSRAGRYQVVVKGSCDPPVISREAQVRIFTVAPSIASLSIPAGVCVGEQAVLTVEAQDARSYQWRKDGIDIPGAFAATLTIDNFAESHVGRYSVRVEGVCDPAIVSEEVEVALYTAPAITIQPSDQGGVEGALVAFAIEASGGNLRYQWRKDGVDIPGATEVELRLPNLTADAAGQYSCVVTNDCGTITSEAATLTIVPKAPVLTVSEQAVVFDPTYINNQRTLIIDGFITNTGTDNLAVSTVSIEGDDASAFAIVAGGGAFDLAPTQTRAMTLAFLPTTAGMKNGRLVFVSNAINAPSITLSGEGIAPSVAIPDTVVFTQDGAEFLGRMTVRNEATLALTFKELLIHLNPSDQFTVVEPLPLTVLEGQQEREVLMRFSPITGAGVFGALTTQFTEVEDGYITVLDASAALPLSIDDPQGATPSVLQIYPNPMREQVVLSWPAFYGQAYEVVITDVLGRIVFQHQGEATAEMMRMYWSGHQANGKPCAAGLYQAVVRIGTQNISQSFVILR